MCSQVNTKQRPNRKHRYGHSDGSHQLIKPRSRQPSAHLLSLLNGDEASELGDDGVVLAEVDDVGLALPLHDLQVGRRRETSGVTPSAFKTTYLVFCFVIIQRSFGPVSDDGPGSQLVEGLGEGEGRDEKKGRRRGREDEEKRGGREGKVKEEG